MTRTFIEVPLFSRRWREIGLWGRRIEDVAGNVAEGPGVRIGDGRYRWNS